MGTAGTLAVEGPITASDILGNVLGSLVPLAMSPGGVVVLLLLVLSLCRRLRGVTAHKDPKRRFSRAEKAEILRRAGGRCEHHHVLYGRCPEQARLEADHVHPHSRGGWTDLANGQALCRRHNKAKWTRVPSNRELRQLTRRRASYFPPGIPALVTRRTPKGTYVPPPPAPPLARLMAPPTPHPTVTPAPVDPRLPFPDHPQMRGFDPPRPVEVFLDGAWRPALQQAWRREGSAWTAEVSWFAGYSVNGGRQVATVPAERVRLAAPRAPQVP